VQFRSFLDFCEESARVVVCRFSIRLSHAIRLALPSPSAPLLTEFREGNWFHPLFRFVGQVLKAGFCLFFRPILPVSSAAFSSSALRLISLLLMAASVGLGVCSLDVFGTLADGVFLRSFEHSLVGLLSA